MKFAICQLADNLSQHHSAWSDLIAWIAQEQPDLAVLNEMPFGAWLANRDTFESDLALASVHAHEQMLLALQHTATAVLSSRPVQGSQRLANEAFLLADGLYQAIHHKQYFPQEPGFYESSWFAPQLPGFDVADYRGLRIGVLLCTELMFTEWARHYRRLGAHVIVVPRASGTSVHNWHTAAAMAAIVSGCYVLSSNRASAKGDPEPAFGGHGFAYSPTGKLLAETSHLRPFACVEIDLAQVAKAQQSYPCYVAELDAPRPMTRSLRMAALALFTTIGMPCLSAVLSPVRPVTVPSSMVSASRQHTDPIPLEAIAKTGRPYDAAWSADSKSLFVSHNQTGRVNLWRYDLNKPEGTQLIKSDNIQDNLNLTPDGKALTFVEDQAGNENYDILSIPVRGGAATNLTHTTDVSEWAATFAPDGKRMAFLRKAKTSPTTEIAIMELASGTAAALTEGTDRDKEWDLIGWSADGKTVYANLRAIDYSKSGIYRIDVASRRVDAMLPLKPGAQAIGAAVSPDGRFIALSADDGVGAFRAGLLDTASGAVRWMSASPWDQHAQAFAPDGKSWLVRTQSDARTALTLVGVADFSERLLPLPHGVIYSGGTQPFSPDGRMIAFSRSSSAAPPEEWIFDLAAGKSRQLTHIADPRVDPDSMPTSEVVTYQSFDGTLISAVLTMPRGVLRNGRNPAVVEVHGGPMDQARDGYDGTAAALATQGFIVIQPNYRGSQGYGRAFQNGNRGDLGGADLRDVVIAKDFLVATGFVDSGRVGIVGGSYGGYMTLMALGKANEAFAAGVQYFGVVDWALYMESADARLRGIFQDLLGDDPRAWITSSPSHYLDRVRVPLLSLQGDNDIRVPRSQAEMVEARLKADGVTAETVFYPDEGHSFAREATRLDALRRTVDWFRRYLVAKDAR